MNLEEQSQLLVRTYGRFERINKLLDAHFHTLHQRAQILVGIAGVLLTSSVMLTAGKLIARSDVPHLHVASSLLIAAGVADILAAGIAIVGVLRIRWVIPPTDDLQRWVMARLQYRDRKTHALHTAIAFLLASMILYQVGASIVLARL